METVTTHTGRKPRRFSGWQVIGIVALVMLVTALITAFIVKRYLWPDEFRPVELSQSESRELDTKLERLGLETNRAPGPGTPGEPLVVEPYNENAASRDIYFAERELNALLARNTNMADRLAVNLSNNLASAKMLVPLEEDFPMLGGRTLRVTAGVEMAFQDNRPVIVLKGVSLMGVPIPNAWLGNLKNVDLVREFGGNDGFWKTFAAGVELIEVTDGKLHIRLKE